MTAIRRTLVNEGRAFGMKVNPCQKGMSRREFLGDCAKYSLLFSSLASISSLFHFVEGAEAFNIRREWGLIKTKLSPYYTPLDGKQIRCELCPTACVVSDGERGYCEVRENRSGKYYSLVYGNPVTWHIDPIEKKPFFHVLPATGSFSIATTGCNFDCKFCQNYEISQARPEETANFDMPAELVVAAAKRTGCKSIASTYVEPTIFYEYMYDIGVLTREEGILNVCHSNGYINQKPLKALCKVLDAACIDLKGFTEEYYRSITEGTLQPVLETLKTLKGEGVHVEIVNLVVPTKNDDMDQIRQMCLWIKETLGSDTPIHFSRFYPMYKLRNLPPTPVSTLEQARKVGLSVGLEYVYIGNVPGHEGENTHCPKCKKLLIQRIGYRILQNHLIGRKCRYCGHSLPGIWA
jgi:pyruvate formate lyase activating enzyme